MAKTRKPELEINMPANHHNDTPISLDEDTKAAALKKIQDSYQALAFVHDFIKSGSFTVSTRYNGLSLAQSHLDDVKKMLGADEDEKQKRENDRNHLRAANQENQRLREEMAKGVTAEAVGHKLYALKNIVYEWWKRLGFSYADGTFDAHGHGGSLKVNFRVNIDTHLDFLEKETPVTSRKKKDEKIENLSDVLDLYPESQNDLAVIDNPKNRAWVLNKLKTRFPAIRIFKVNSRMVHKTDFFELSEIEAYIQVEDIEEDEDGDSA